MSARVLVLAPTWRARTETFVRANLARLPGGGALFRDEIPWSEPSALYTLAVLTSKVCTRLGWLLATVPSSTWPCRCDVTGRMWWSSDFRFVWGWSCPHRCAPGGSLSRRRCLGGALPQASGAALPPFASVISADVKNRTMRDRLIALGAQPAQLLISPSGADEQRFQGATPASTPPRFLAVGRFVAKKGPLDTLEAFAAMRRLTRHASACRLVMVGDGPLLAAVQERARQLGLEQSVAS